MGVGVEEEECRRRRQSCYLDDGSVRWLLQQRLPYANGYWKKVEVLWAVVVPLRRVGLSSMVYSSHILLP